MENFDNYFFHMDVKNEINLFVIINNKGICNQISRNLKSIFTKKMIIVYIKNIKSGYLIYR